MSSVQQMLAEDELANILSTIGSDFDRKGELTIKFKIATKNGVILINSSVKATLSEPERLPTQMFLDDEGNLGRRDPRQPPLPSFVDADVLNSRRNAQQ